jgi:predicted metal-binding membrane protein
MTPVRDRATVLTSVVLLVVAAAAWVSVVRSSLRGDDDMMMTMPMPATVADGFAFLLGWGIMMTAMMLPSALPMISLYGAMGRGAAGGGATQGRAAGTGAQGVPVAGFTAVYLLVWAASGIPVYLAHTVLMTLPGPAFAYGIALILLAAGAFQLSPLKQACLRACRSPLGFLLGHWRAGRRGSLALGWAHAVYCLGCCWALMLVLVAAGAMGLRWVLLITAVVAAEKLLPGGEWIARAAGVAFLLLGVTMAVRPELAMVLRGAHAM